LSRDTARLLLLTHVLPSVVLTPIVKDTALRIGELLFIAVENLTHLVQLIFTDFTVLCAVYGESLRCSGTVHRISLLLRTGGGAFSNVAACAARTALCSTLSAQKLLLDFLVRLVNHGLGLGGHVLVNG
jgi:hypothetical protein